MIEELKPNNPAYYERLYERLRRIIQDEEERRLKNADYFTDPEKFEEIYNEALAEEEEREKRCSGITRPHNLNFRCTACSTSPKTERDQ